MPRWQPCPRDASFGALARLYARAGDLKTKIEGGLSSDRGGSVMLGQIRWRAARARRIRRSQCRRNQNRRSFSCRVCARHLNRMRHKLSILHTSHLLRFYSQDGGVKHSLGALHWLHGAKGLCPGDYELATTYLASICVWCD